MKATESKTTTAQSKQQQAQEPFFKQEGKEAFFSENQTENAFINGQNQNGNPSSFFSPATVQPKLTIGQPNDKFEKEADSVADRVVKQDTNSPATPNVQTAPAPEGQEEKLQKQEEEELSTKEEEVQRKPIFESAGDPPEDGVQRQVDVQLKAREKEPKEETPEAQAKSLVQTQTDEKDKIQEKPIFESEAAPAVQKEAAPEGEEKVQSKSESNGTPTTGNLPTRLDSSKGKGQALSPNVRSSMESSIGADFSGVRVHTDQEAVQMNKDLNAQAFTHGSDIYFNEGKYDTGSSEGKHLLAHELTHTVQQGASGESIQRKPEDHKHEEDGKNVKNRMHQEAKEEVGDDADFSKPKSAMTAEEKEKAKDVDPGKKSAKKGKIKSSGKAEPDVNRPKKELPKVEEAKEEGKENLKEEPETKDKKDQKKKPPRADLAESDAKENAAVLAYQQAAQVEMPAKPQPLKEPRIEKPKDSKGEPLPENAANDKAVRALHEIAKLFVENAYSMKEEAAKDQKQGFKMRAKLDKSWAKTARVKSGSKLMKEDTDAREEVNVLEEEALTKVEKDTAMVKAEAPKLKEKSDKGREEAGPMVEESKEKKKEMEAEKPDDADAAKDAEKQSKDTGEVADGSQKTDDALSGTGDRAEKYLQDAEAGEKKNEQTRATVDENKGTLENTRKEIARIDDHNAQSEAQLAALNSYPAQVAQETALRAQNGDQLYAAAVTINDQLVDTQEQYYTKMAGLKSREEAQAELDAKQKEESPPAEQKLTPEEELLIGLSDMSEEEIEATLLGSEEEEGMSQKEMEGLQTALQGMPTEEEAAEEEGIVGKADEAGRKKVDLMKVFDSDDKEQGPPDPRQEEIGKIEGERTERIMGVKQLADANFTFLSAEQKAMLAQKLAFSNAVSGLFDINILEMGKGMIMGMINPVESLKGVIDGASKMASGVVNLFNAEAWKKDPLGNLLQSAADIMTGLTMIFMSITGLATAITIIMTAITIASLGFAAPITGPIISFMATVISTVGSWTIVTGLIALELNALTYIKNLHDAGTAENTDELIFESDQLKQNMTDGFTSAMAVVGAKGDVAGAKAMKSAISKGGGATKFFKQKGMNFKKGAQKMGGKVLGAGKKAIGGVKRMTKAGITKVRTGITKAIQKAKKGLKEGFENVKSKFKKKGGGPKDKFKNKKAKTEGPGPGKLKTPKDGGSLGSVGGKKVKAEMDLPGGHKVKSLEGGQCAICSNCKTIRGKFREELAGNPKLETKLKRIEKRLAKKPSNKKLLKKQLELHDELVSAQVRRIGKEVKEIEDLLASGNRSLSKKQYKDFARKKRLLEQDLDATVDMYTRRVSPSTRKYGAYSRKGKVDKDLIRKELHEGRGFDRRRKSFSKGDSKKVRSGSSKRLKTRINDPLAPPYFQAHHVIPIEIFDRFHSFFKKIDFDIDSPKNGILLPPDPKKLKPKQLKDMMDGIKSKGTPDSYMKRTTHHGSHPNYSGRVGNQIDALATQLEKLKSLDPKKIAYFQGEVQNIIDKLKKGLDNGTEVLN